MGIQGLLPLLKSIQKPCSLRKFAGETVGVDAYGWLHRGTVSCAMELATGKPTRKFVDFVMHRVRMLQHYGVTPYIVFDGDYLPGKAGTEKDREKKREASRKLGLELEKAGKVSQAYQELQKAVDVTPEMAGQFIEELKAAGIQYVVAPYEADAQLVYLERQGIISAILSEDSDLLVFGAKCLLTKLDQYGECIEINKVDFSKCREVCLTGWSDVEFRQMAILSGCDYLPSINGMGLKTAYRLLRKHKTVDRVVRMLQFDGKFSVPKGYIESFRQAELTFLHQWVFCPIQEKLVFHTEPSQSLGESEMPFIGAYVEPEVAREVASGNLNPITKTPLRIKSINTMAAPGTPLNSRSNVRRAVSAASDRKNGPTIDNFFKPKRIPLGEMSVNDFSHSPSQLEVLRRNSGVSWDTIPVPESENSELARHSPPIQLPRNYILPSLVTQSTQPASPARPLSRGRSISSSMLLSDARSPKRPRLCSDNLSDNLPSSSRQSDFGPSRFFASSTIGSASPSARKLGKNSRCKNKEEFGIFSDDSIEEAFANMPDEVFNPKAHKKDQGQRLPVFKDDDSKVGEKREEQAQNCEEVESQVLQNTPSSVPSLTQSTSITSNGEAPPTPVDTPTAHTTTALSKFAFTSTPTLSKSAPRSAFVHGLATPPTRASKIPIPTVVAKTRTDENAILRGMSSALQRLGARAINAANFPATTPPPTPRPMLAKSTTKKNSVPFPEVARAKEPEVVSVKAACDIPLPPVDEEESVILSEDSAENPTRIGGSEDQIVHDSEEEELDGEDDKPKFDLSRFSYAV